MGCNCKKARSYEEANGYKEEESILGKYTRQMIKIGIFALTILLAVIITPIIILVAIYKIFFGDRNIPLPKFMGKYMEMYNGQKL
jgi:hypothetical protein